MVTVLPFGRQQRIPHALYLTKLLETLAAQLEGSTFCFVSAEHPSSYFELARAAGESCERLEMIASVPVGSMLATPRCYVNLANAVCTSSASTDCSGDPIQAAHPMTHGAAHTAKRTRCLLLPTPFSAYVTPHLPIYHRHFFCRSFELLSGGGLKSAALDEPLSSGDLLELQCRAPDGRCWLRARVATAALVSSPDCAQREWTCELDWLDVEAARQLPRALSLSEYSGVNWRLPSP